MDDKITPVGRTNTGSPARDYKLTRTPTCGSSTSVSDNPLAGLNSSELGRKVQSFVDLDEDLTKHKNLLVYGAKLAQDKEVALGNNTERVEESKKLPVEGSIEGLSSEQKEYLRDFEEQSGFLDQSKYLKGSLLSACLAGIIQGWTQSVINGANIGMSDNFNLHYRPSDDKRTTKDSWIFGVLTAAPFLAGGILAPFVADPLQEHLLGRRGAIAVACVLSIAATVGQSFSRTIIQLIGCRIVTGLALAAKASSAPLLTAEIAPNHLRGNFLSTWQLSDAFGIFLGFAANLAALNIYASDKIIWRIQIATVLIPTTILLFVVYLMPESPRFLMKKGWHAKALESFTLLRPSPVSELLAARDLIYAHLQLEMECQSMENRRATPDDKGKENTIEDSGRQRAYYDISRTNYFQRLSQTFRDGRSRRALVCASTAMIAQQFTGINTIAFLSATLLNEVHASNRTGAWVGFGIGLCNFLFGMPAFWLLEKVGRARMLLLGFVPMFVLMFLIAFSFRGGKSDTVDVPLLGVSGILFIIAYSPTAGPTPFAISAEVFPLVVREVGHSLAVAVNFLGLGILLLTFPFLSNAMGGYRASLLLFAVLNLVAFLLCFLFVPETKERTLEELQSIFDRPLREHVQYRTTYLIPWLVGRCQRLLKDRMHAPTKPKPGVGKEGRARDGQDRQGQGDQGHEDQGSQGDQEHEEEVLVPFHRWKPKRSRARR